MNIKVEASRDNIPILRVDLADASQEGQVLFIGDVHWDNSKCDRKALKRLLDEALERRAAIVDLGDWFDAMQGPGDRRATKSALREEHQRDDYFNALVETSARWLEPYAGNFAVMLTGNHETAVTKHHEIDLTAAHVTALKALGSPVIYGGYQTYALMRLSYAKTQRQTVPLWLEHGHGGGGAVTKGVIQAQRRAVTYPDARIVLSGHVHSSYYVAHEQWRVSQAGVVSRAEQEHYVVNTFKDEWGTGRKGWHVERGRGPRVPSGWWARFYYRNNAFHWEFTRAK